MDALIFLGILIAVILVGIGGVFLFRKFKISKEEAEFAMMLLDTLDFIVGQIEPNKKEEISEVIKYVIMAINYVFEFKKNVGDYTKLKEEILSETLFLCTKNDVKVDQQLLDKINQIADFLIANYIVEK